VDKNTELLNQLRIDRSAEPRASKAWIWLLVGLVVFAIGATSVWLVADEDPIPVRVQMARVTTVNPAAASVLDATGYVRARRYATVSSKVTGKVMEVLIEEGMRVEQNQIVARLDDINAKKMMELAEAELVSAKTHVNEVRARLKEAQLNLQRLDRLADKELVSPALVDEARANHESLQAQLANREAGVVLAERRKAIEQQHLDDLILRAPFTGIVISKDSQPGEMISPVSAGGGFTRTGICTIVDMTSLEIEVDVNETYIQRVRPDQPVVATLEAYNDWKIAARVIAIIPTADRQKATVKVRIAFDQLDERILPDMGVKVSFLNPEPTPNEGVKPQGLRVPATAVRQKNNQTILFVVKDKVASARVVELQPSGGSEFIVLSGLTPGEDFIVVVPDELNDGSRVDF
jgi:RND family efflux transporter MFP subunit